VRTVTLAGRHRGQLSLRPGQPQVSLGEHMATSTAITGRHPDEAGRVMRRHLRGVVGAPLDHRQPGNAVRRAGGLVIMNGDQIAGAGEAATSTV
jgi:DNA-binding GntR family transcriptional regulator